MTDVTSTWFFILGIVLFIVGLAISIGLHELGHLIPAKIFKVPVSKYFIGFGPTLFSRKRGETEYGVKLIPLGGYVSIGGMYPPRSEQTKKSRMPTFMRKIVEDAQDSNADSMEGFDESRAFYRLPAWKRIIVMVGGPFMNLLLAFVLFAIVLVGIGKPGATTTVEALSPCIYGVTQTQSVCDSDSPASPSVVGGLKPGDRLVSIDGQPVDNWSAGTAVIQRSSGKQLAFVVERAGKPVTLTITPVPGERYKVDAAGDPILGNDGKPVLATVGVIGVVPKTGFVPQPMTSVFSTMSETVTGTVQLIGNLPNKLGEVTVAAFGSEERPVDSPVSVVGVGRVAGEIASTDAITPESKLATGLSVLASLNVALFVFNLIPLLPLDGGHIASALFDVIRRKVAAVRSKKDPGPFDASVLMPLTFVVMAVLMAMSALLIYADIVKPITVFG